MFSGLINPNVAIFNTILSQILNFSGFSTFSVFAAFKKKIEEDLRIFASVCLDTMDFSSMTLTQIKRQEMDAQVRTTLVRDDEQFYLNTLCFCNTANFPHCGINEEISDLNEWIWFGSFLRP